MFNVASLEKTLIYTISQGQQRSVCLYFLFIKEHFFRKKGSLNDYTKRKKKKHIGFVLSKRNDLGQKLSHNCA